MSEPNSSSGQRWKYYENEELIENELNDELALDVEGQNRSPGTVVWMYGKNGTAAQKWRFIPIDQSSNSTDSKQNSKTYKHNVYSILKALRMY
jgi:hypothetical protein